VSVRIKLLPEPTIFSHICFQKSFDFSWQAALQNRSFKPEGFLGGKEFFFSNDADGMLFPNTYALWES